MKILKNRSITNKLLIIYSVVFFVMLSLIVLANYFFLDDFFVYYNKIVIEDEMDLYQKGAGLDFEKANMDLTRNTGGILYVYNEENDLVWNNDQRQQFNRISEAQVLELREKVYEENIHFTLFRSDMLAESKLVYAFDYGDGSFLILVKQMGVLHEVQQILFLFLVIITGLIYILAFVIIFISSNQISKPIIDLKNATEKVAKMDFDVVLDEDGDNEITDLAVSINDMSRNLKKNIEALNESNELLERELSRERNLETMRRQFVSDVSHELKNPISMIIAYAEGLVRKIPKTEESHDKYCGIILEEGQKINQLISDLLDLSSYQSGTFTINKEEFSLTELLESAIERFSHVNSEKSIEYQWHKEEEVFIFADRLRMDQVVVNLISNAVKNVEVGGIIQVSLKESDKGVTLLIKNTGKLIPEDKLNNIWESFYQVDTDTKGNGLGLAITKSIVALHKGDIRAYVSQDMNCFEVII